MDRMIKSGNLELPPLVVQPREKLTEKYLDEVLDAVGAVLQYVEESPVLIPHLRQVSDDLALLEAFLSDPPKQLIEDGTLEDIEFFIVKRMRDIMWCHDLEKMDQDMARELVKRLNFILILESHLLDLVRMFYGKKPRASPSSSSSVSKNKEKEPKAASRVYFADNLAHLDTLLDHLQRSPPSHPWTRSLSKHLALLKAIFMDPPLESIEDGTLRNLESLAMEVGSIISSVDVNNMDQDMADELDVHLYTIKSLRGLVKPVRMIYAGRPKPSRVYHPMTSQLGFVDHFADNLGELLLKAKADYSIAPLQFDILELQQQLQLLSSQVMDISEQRKEEVDLKDVITNITNYAYEAEYVIDSFLVGDIPIWCCMFWLRDILPELHHQQRLLDMESGDPMSIVSSILHVRPGEHKIIPIVNKSTGIGDTLRCVYDDFEIRAMYEVCTRSVVSSYVERKKEVLFNLLHNASSIWEHLKHDEIKYASDMSEEIKYTSDMSGGELEESVHNLLKDKSYFIILEDLQDIDVLNDIRRVLPHTQYKRNVILLTTSSPELVVQCRNGYSKMFGRSTSTLLANVPTAENDVVGLVEETKRMLQWLIEGSRKLCIISIVGMAGQGKTTLAKKLYNDPLVFNYFHTCAWCYVSQVYEKEEILLELSGQLIQHSNTIRHKNDEELAELLYKHLKGRRFLVVLDDVWRIDVWNDLARCFPDDNNGSRIIFTTRIKELSFQAKPGSILETVYPLSDEDSWELLRKKLFQKESCPPSLVGLGRKIARDCKGLPLSVVLIAGLLAKMEKNIDQWEHVAKALSFHILGNAETLGKGVIKLSYRHLPDHLKPCFLYVGVFLEDKEIFVSKLIRLWVAEGFIKHSDLKSLEDVSEDYLADLIGRSLVTVVHEKSIGGVKSCRVHDLLREFCLSKAKEENFFQYIPGYDEHFASFNDNFDYGADPNYSCSSTPLIYHVRRVSIYSKRNHFIMLKPSGPFVRTLLYFAASDIGPCCSYDISFIFHNFKFLRILHLEDINIDDCLKAIHILVLLRYLAIQGYVDLIPSSIANLWNLETLIVKALGGKVVKVPDSIWDMTKLRHIQVNENATFDLKPHRLDNSSMLDNLQTISTPSLAYGDDMEKILRRLQGIQKLKCTFLDSWDDARNCNRLPELGFLNQLVSLKVSYKGEGKHPWEFRFPSNLKKLTLLNFRMPWTEISQLAALRNLEVLKLLGNALEGERWEMEDEVFPKLKFLKLDTLNIVEWSATSDHFPHLERLLLHKCQQLEEIPPGIGDIPTLQMIEVMWCNPSAAISAKKIQEEQLDFSNEGLNIHVYPKVWDLESS